MSLHDIQTVDIDYYERTFTVIRNDGTVKPYKIGSPCALFREILEQKDHIDIYEIVFADNKKYNDIADKNKKAILRSIEMQRFLEGK